MMSSRKRKRLDDDIDALLLSSNAFKRKNKKREKRLKRLDPSLHVRMTERSHPSWLPPRFKKSRSRSVEREKKKSKNSRSFARSSKVVPFPVLLRTARCSSAIPSSVFPTFSSVSPLYIFTSAVFVSTTTKVVERLLFIHFGLGPLFGFILCRAKNFPLSLSSLSLSLSLSFDYIYIHIREEVKEVLFKTGGGHLEESLFF